MCGEGEGGGGVRRISLIVCYPVLTNLHLAVINFHLLTIFDSYIHSKFYYIREIFFT